MNNKFSAYLIGENTLLIQCAEILLARGHGICGVVAANSMVIDWAKTNDIHVIDPKDDVLGILSQQPFDFLFSIANLSVIPAPVLALPRKLAINFHDGPLPRYAGLNAPAWALMNFEKTHGITWHVMQDKVDAGNILKQEIFEIAEGETAFTLNAKCYDAATRSFAGLVEQLECGDFEGVPQDLEAQTYFSKYQRPYANGVISWHCSAEEIDALVRALDFGPYANPLTLAKLLIGDRVLLVPEIEISRDNSTMSGGTVIEVNDEMLRVATSTYDVVLRNLLTIDGQFQSISELVRLGLLAQGYQLETLDPVTSELLTGVNNAIVRHEAFWLKRLSHLQPLEPPFANRNMDSTGQEKYAALMQRIPASFLEFAANAAGAERVYDVVVAAISAYLVRITGESTFDLGFRDLALQQTLGGFENYFASHVPLHVEVDPAASAGDTFDALLNATQRVRKNKSYSRSVVVRYPELAALRRIGGLPTFPIVIEQMELGSIPTPQEKTELSFFVSEDGSTCLWVYQTGVLAENKVTAMQQQFATFLENTAADPDRPLAQISLLSEADYQRIMVEWNATCKAYDADGCIHRLIEAQVVRTPDAVAVAFEDQQLTYAQLNAKANQLANYLCRMGVGPETRVGIYMNRSLDLVVGLLGIHKAGGAYVPLDPAYPADRIAYMIEDAGLGIILTQDNLIAQLPPHQANAVAIDYEWPVIARENDANVQSSVEAGNVAYVIYTSGSTGKPKGVMVQHGNVANFFTAMDDCIPHDPPGVWLAVTSLSFDISVLELFWTLARGFKVVVYADTDKAMMVRQPTTDFSLFYFASDEGEGVADKYELLLEGAKRADAAGFSAIWTPERHFGTFGGLYPNPSVTSAAIAAVTKQIKIRAGSCVSPLHSPIRIAEEWALVDNLSKGRVGISFAAGWQPNDFVLKPENFADRKERMFRDIETVQKLWRGESVIFPGPTGKDVEIRTLPRPVQKELPTWVTVAGNPETFSMAGAQGHNILTHLLGQTVEQLGEKLELYRKARRENGHDGPGHITLMLHTFVGDDDDEVREIVRQPMKNYLSSAMDLIEKAVWSFPTFQQKQAASGKSLQAMFADKDLTAEEKEAILNYAFERYFETSGLFGTVETCMKMVNKLKTIGVDEIACLIDFGVPSKLALKHLEHLTRLRELSNPAPEAASSEYSLPALIDQHAVTHLQCTPSLARMLMINDDSRNALKKLQNLVIGGEAFPVALANELNQLVQGSIINMYGPTETTVWSSSYTLSKHEEIVPIGRPIANTTFYILDKYYQPTPVGVPGELFIGGDGVTRGYLNRPELTAERFIPDPFSDDPAARLYRTGDLARYLEDGNVEFLGRNDFQVKIRGHRIELGEIEKWLDQHPAVNKSVVVAREDVPGDKRLVAYMIPNPQMTIVSAEIRSFLKENLPEFMIPSHFVTMSEFPLTPNLKTDRKALPAPDEVSVEHTGTFVPPTSEMEKKIAEIWRGLLSLSAVGVKDSFFDLGGHSILVVQAHRRICETLKVDFSVADLFRFTTIQTLANHLQAL